MKQLNIGNQINLLEHNVKILYIERVNGFILMDVTHEIFWKVLSMYLKRTWSYQIL